NFKSMPRFSASAFTDSEKLVRQPLSEPTCEKPTVSACALIAAVNSALAQNVPSNFFIVIFPRYIKNLNVRSWFIPAKGVRECLDCSTEIPGCNSSYNITFAAGEQQ